MKTLKFVLVYFVTIGLFAQTQISPLSNFMLQDMGKGSWYLKSAYEFKNLNLNFAYQFSSQLAIFSGYNYQNAKYHFNPILGDMDTNHIQDDGITIGCAYFFKNDESNFWSKNILLGLDLRKADLKRYDSNNPSFNDHNSYQYNRYFSQLNVIREKEKLIWVLSGKLSMVEIHNYKSEIPDYENLYEGANIFSFDTSAGVLVKFYKSENLKLNSQIGISFPLNKLTEIESDGSYTTETTIKYSPSIFMNLGISYSFKMNEE
jgi:hypothetical protein